MPVILDLFYFNNIAGGCCGPAIDGTMDSDSDTDDVFDAEDASKSLIQTAEADINKVLPVAKAIPKSVSRSMCTSWCMVSYEHRLLNEMHNK